MTMLEWRKYHSIEDISVLDEIERDQHIVFSNSYRQTTSKFDHGIPSSRRFLVGSEERMIDRLISVSMSFHPNVIDATTWLDQTGAYPCIPFALDPFGSMICFQYKSNTEYDVVFIDHETGNVVSVCNSFDGFVNLLY